MDTGFRGRELLSANHGCQLHPARQNTDASQNGHRNWLPAATAFPPFLIRAAFPRADPRSSQSNGHYRDAQRTALTKICKELSLPRVTAHELRHSCTELYIEAGASAEDIRRLLNQSSLTATARYIHRTDERLTKIAGNIVKS